MLLGRSRAGHSEGAKGKKEKEVAAARDCVTDHKYDSVAMDGQYAHPSSIALYCKL
jgi:hypothetical protein